MPFQKTISGAGLGVLLAACGGPSSSRTHGMDSGATAGWREAGAPDAGTGAFWVCGRADTAAECFACCADYFPNAGQALLAASASCACSPSYCGLAEAGTAAPGDGSALDANPGGESGGTCGASVCSLQAAPSADCLQCVLGLIEGASGPPLCSSSLAGCHADPACAPLLTCSQNCPGTTLD